MKINLLISFVVSLVVFIVVYAIEYFKLLRVQPSNVKMLENSTSFPPSSAWVIALPWGIITFVVVLLILLLVFKKQ